MSQKVELSDELGTELPGTGPQLVGGATALHRPPRHVGALPPRALRPRPRQGRRRRRPVQTRLLKRPSPGIVSMPPAGRIATVRPAAALWQFATSNSVRLTPRSTDPAVKAILDPRRLLRWD